MGRCKRGRTGEEKNKSKLIKREGNRAGCRRVKGKRSEEVAAQVELYFKKKRKEVEKEEARRQVEIGPKTRKEVEKEGNGRGQIHPRVLVEVRPQ